MNRCWLATRLHRSNRLVELHLATRFDIQLIQSHAYKYLQHLKTWLWNSISFLPFLADSIPFILTVPCAPSPCWSTTNPKLQARTLLSTQLVITSKRKDNSISTATNDVFGTIVNGWAILLTSTATAITKATSHRHVLDECHHHYITDQRNHWSNHHSHINTLWRMRRSQFSC